MAGPRKIASSKARRELRQIHADFQEELLARKRIGSTREQRLRWLVERFLRTDLATLRAEERVALGYDLLALVPGGRTVARFPGPMSEAQIGALHEEVSRGIRAIVRGQSWALPPTGTVVLMLRREKGSREQHIDRAATGDDTQAVVAGIERLLIHEGSRLRACDECSTPFVARKRQAYCSPKCSQRTRTRRKRQGERITR